MDAPEAKPLSHAVVSDMRKRFFIRGKKGKIILTVSLLVLIAGGVGGIIYYRITQRVTEADVSKIESEATAQNAAGHASAALQIYRKAFANAANNSVRIELGLQAADLALSTNHLDDALQFALSVDSIIKTPDSSNLVANIYQRKGNKTEAVAYYKKAASEVDPKQLSGLSKQYLLYEAQAVMNGSKQ